MLPLDYVLSSMSNAKELSHLICNYLQWFSNTNPVIRNGFAKMNLLIQILIKYLHVPALYAVKAKVEKGSLYLRNVILPFIN